MAGNEEHPFASIVAAYHESQTPALDADQATAETAPVEAPAAEPVAEVAPVEEPVAEVAPVEGRYAALLDTP